jgi:hypothetical protein
MLGWAVTVWIAGLLTVVPYGTYYLLFEARTDQYALLITLVLFWIFGYWGMAGPVLALIKIRRVFKAIERARSRDDLLGTLRSADARDTAIDLIASENRIPRFLAVRVYNLLLTRLPSAGNSSSAATVASSRNAGLPRPGKRSD